jgi:hypothetical protein
MVGDFALPVQLVLFKIIDLTNYADPIAHLNVLFTPYDYSGLLRGGPGSVKGGGRGA